MKIITIIIFALAATACTSTGDKETDDLDVAMPSTDEDEKSVTYADVVPTKPAGEKVPANAVMNWQSFFKAPPTTVQRKILEAKLAKWIEKETPDELVAKGRMEIAVGRLAAAETSLRRALRLKPDHLDASLELASLYIRQRDLTRAFEFLAQVRDGIATSENLPNEFVLKYRYTLALGYVHRGDRDKGHAILSDLIGVDKGFAPAYAALASSYLATGKEGVAEFVVRRGLDRCKDDPTLMNLMGVIAQRQRQTDTALQWYERALAAAPAFVPALVNRAILHTKNLEYAAAEQDLVRALHHDPQNVEALVALGIVQRKQGNITAARASLSKAVDLRPDDAHARFNLGVLMVDDLKRPSEAMRLFHEVMQTPGATEDVKRLAKTYLGELQQSSSL
jgi:Tfp pilus assembly protein PilF